MSAAITRHEAHAEVATLEMFRFSDTQRKLILDTCCGGASAQEAAVLIGIAEMRGLNPVTQECYFVKRWDSQRNANVWAVQVSIDAMRIKAEETGLYAGQDEPEFEYAPDGKTPVLARVRIYRRDWERPMVGVARWSEFVQKTKDGHPTKFWRDMPHNQLAKVAEAAALRKAFPRRLAKLYTIDEMAQASNDAPDLEGEVVQPPPRLRPASVPPPAPSAVSPMSAAEAAQMTMALETAPTVEDIRKVGQRIKALVEKGVLTLDQAADLRELAKARKAALAAPPPMPADPTQATQEALGDNEMPGGWGGEQPAAEPPVGPHPAEETEPCVYCGAPVVLNADAVQVTSPDGEVGYRHYACRPPAPAPTEAQAKAFAECRVAVHQTSSMAGMTRTVKMLREQEQAGRITTAQLHELHDLVAGVEARLRAPKPAREPGED